MKNNRILLAAFALVFCTLSFHSIRAQNVGINATGAIPHSSAILDVDAAPGNNLGMLIPRLALLAKNNAAPVTNPATSLLVYNTATAGVAPNNVVPGFYYWNGTIWVLLQTANNSWNLQGNAGTSTNDFIGTTDNMDLQFKVNNLNSGLISNAKANTFLGYKAGEITKANTGYNNVFLGAYSGKLNTIGYGNNFIGMQAGENNVDGDNNIALGVYALQANVSGIGNTAIGLYSLKSNSANYNIGLGWRTLFANTTGEFNIAIGYNALDNNLIGDNNVAIGNDACSVVKGSDNIGIGQQAVFYSTTANFNIGIGKQALENSTGGNNVGLGVLSLNANTTGTNNTALGYNSFLTGTTFSNSTALGANTVITAGNQIRLGNNTVTSIGGFQNWTNVSDARFKKDIQENVPGLDFILKLRPVTYHLDLKAVAEHLNIPDRLRHSEYEQLAESLLQSGFIAQEVEEAASASGFDFSGVDKPKNEGDFYGLRYATFVVPLVKAVQEQQTQLQEQHVRIALLEAQIASLLHTLKP